MTATDRADDRLRFARAATGDPDLDLHPASSDASFRSYWRGHSGHRSWIVMDAPPEREDIRPWLEIDLRLRQAGLLAPEVIASDAEHGFVVMTDLGDRLLLPALSADTVDPLYRQALDSLVSLQVQADSAGLPEYDEARLVAEMELMPTWFLERHLGVLPECEQWDIIESAFRALVGNALEQPKVFVHRDFHSRNLMLHGDALAIIDFQDAVRGPVTYDPVSLLRDCYIAWPEQQVYRLLEDYRRRLLATARSPADRADRSSQTSALARALADCDGARFRRWFDLMGLQRHLKVLGIFCRLYYRDGKSGYLNDLPRVWDYVHRVGREYDAIRPLVDLLERAIAGRDLTEPNPTSDRGDRS